MSGDESRDDCRVLLKPRYVADDRHDAREVAKDAWRAVVDRFGNYRGYHIRIELADGSVVRWRDLNQSFTFSQSALVREADDRDLDPERAQLLEERENLPRWKKNRSAPDG
ncbi:hypothetical protein [Natrinema sp. H-ect4]|uniref:hypothetical protein n=1 Tax=Natrinema sp. H-ect4 TaxID=3242699 RepID=UPI0035A8FC31